MRKEDGLQEKVEDALKDEELSNNFNNSDNSGVIKKTMDSFKYFLLEKNKRYGNSALEPLGVFTSFTSKETQDQIDFSLYARLDDKLSRIKNADHLRKNDVADSIGYLILLCINNDWTNFDDLID